VKTLKEMNYSLTNLPKVGDKFKLPSGKIKVVSLFDLLAAFGGSNLDPNKTDVKAWNKFDRFVHGFLTAARLQKTSDGRKLLKDTGIKVGTGPMNMNAIVQNHNYLNKEVS
jgi:hypothetical protein